MVGGIQTWKFDAATNRDKEYEKRRKELEEK